MSVTVLLLMVIAEKVYWVESVQQVMARINSGFDKF